MALTKLTTKSITGDTLEAGDLAANSVDSSELVDGSVDLSHMSANSIDSDQYVDGSIDLAHMSSESVDEDNLHISNAGSNGNFLQKQSGNTGGLTWASASADADNYFASSGLSSKDLGAGLHIKTADSSATPETSADELVIEGSGNVGMSILAGTSGTSNIFFGDSGDADIGRCYYNHGSNKLTLGAGGVEGWVMDETGAVTKPLQPAVSTRFTGSQYNLATNGWTTLQFGENDTEIFDRNSDFNTSTYTFTAPVTGLYLFCSTLCFESLDADCSYFQIQLSTSNRDYPMLFGGNDWDADPTLKSYVHSMIADMDANDTAIMRFYQQDGTAQADLRADSNLSICLLA